MKKKTKTVKAWAVVGDVLVGYPNNDLWTVTKEKSDAEAYVKKSFDPTGLKVIPVTITYRA